MQLVNLDKDRVISVKWLDRTFIVCPANIDVVSGGRSLKHRIEIKLVGYSEESL